MSNPMTDVAEIARGLTKAQRRAVIDGGVFDCVYNHPQGTRCPNCTDWPFAKGGAAEFLETMRAHLTQVQPQ